jgi:hypothetical protein
VRAFGCVGHCSHLSLLRLLREQLASTVETLKERKNVRKIMASLNESLPEVYQVRPGISATGYRGCCVQGGGAFLCERASEAAWWGAHVKSDATLIRLGCGVPAPGGAFGGGWMPKIFQFLKN